MTSAWIDTHCHLDAPEFAADVQAVRARAAAGGVARCVIPAVAVAHFEAVKTLAHQLDDAYALGIHPLRAREAAPDALAQVQAALQASAADARLVAVGEIGLDYFAPDLAAPGPLRARQEQLFRGQLQLARQQALPVILHVRRSADAVLKALRQTGCTAGGIAHAFAGSRQQAGQFLDLGFKLGFGGAVTYARATRLRDLAKRLPLDALVLETDAPDMPPHWLYTPAGARAAGQPQGRNEPGELPRIAQVIAALRGIDSRALAEAAWANAMAALPRLAQIGGNTTCGPADAECGENGRLFFRVGRCGGFGQ
ncbi:MAG: TatD family hydrolase [Burkholderiaceae bacterium]|jgi:TatD DNase family protein|nr:TatD family hydrolase [Burkholderiaceae bacterium]